MSEFLAEAQVLVRPNTASFRTQLQAQLIAATKGVAIPIAVTPVAAKGVAGAAAATQALSKAQASASITATQVAAAQKQIQIQTQKSTASLLGAANASGKMNAALLGLRTAVGSSAVIGLGALSLAAIAAGAAIRASILNFSKLQQELATFRVTAGASAEDMRRVSDAATALGEDVRLPAVSASDAAIAMTELAKAGLSVQDSIDGARGVLELATAAQISNADAAKIAANALNSFGLAGDQATRVADDFANAANAAQGSIADIGIALQQSSAVARQVGLSLEDTTAILSLFAKSGLQGSDAGTSLRVALIRLVAPTKAAAEEIRKLGLDIRDASGNVRADVFAQFGEATKNLAPSARDAAAALIFGQDAIRAVSIGAREGTDGLRLMQFQIDQTGTAAEVAAARTEGLAGQFSALQSNLQTLGTQFGSIIAIPLTPFLQGLNTAIADVNKLASALLGLKNLDIPSVHIPIQIDFPGLPGVPGADPAKTLAVGIGRKLEGAIPGVGPVLQFANIAGDIQKLVQGTDEAKRQIAGLTAELQSLQKARISAQQGGQRGIADQLTKEINALKDEIKRLQDEGNKIPDTVTNHLQEAIDRLKAARSIRVALNIDTGPIDRLIASLQRSIPITQQVEGNIARLRDDVGDLGTKAQNSAGGVDALTKALAGLGRQASAAQADLLRLQSEGGTPTQIVGALQADVDAQREIIRIRKENGNQPGDASAIAKARQQIISDQNQIDSIQKGIVADQKAATDETKRLAKEAQTQRDKQFQALADTFGGRQTGIENKIERAGIAGNIQKQINLTKALVASLVKERAALLDRLKKLNVSNEVRKRIMAAITAAIENGKQDILRFEKEQQDNVKAFATPAIDLRIRIAQAQDNVAAEIRARRARLAAITKELVKLKNAGKKNTLAWLELKAQQQEEIKAINDLKGTEKERGKSFGELTFEFLQRQQGFAANLLGNLIPGFATSGLVGGSGGGAPAEGLKGAGQFPGTQAKSESTLSSARERGVRPVQVDTTNSLLRQILASLNGKHTQPPEIRHNRGSGGAVFDIF